MTRGFEHQPTAQYGFNRSEPSPQQVGRRLRAKDAAETHAKGDRAAPETPPPEGEEAQRRP